MEAWMADRREIGGPQAHKVLGWTCWVVITAVGLLAADLISEGPERITTDYLIARFAVFGVGWAVGALVLRRRARRAAGGPDKADDAGSQPPGA